MDKVRRYKYSLRKSRRVILEADMLLVVHKLICQSVPKVSWPRKISFDRWAKMVATEMAKLYERHLDEVDYWTIDERDNAGNSPYPRGRAR